MTDRLSRRGALRAGAVAVAVSIAGCGNGGENGGNGGNGGGDGAPATDDPVWEDISEFQMEGRIEAWTFTEPEDVIGGLENPTIALIEGNEYTFTWVNMDGATHNLEIRNDGGEVIDDYATDPVGEEGGEATLEGVVAAPDMTTYICQFHPTTQVGDIEVV